MLATKPKVQEHTHSPEFGRLIERARRSEEAALRELYETNQRQIFRYVLTRVGRREDAEEVTSETFLTMLRLLPRYVGDSPIAFRAWLLKIARCRVADHFRYHGRRPTSPLDDHREAASKLRTIDPEDCLDQTSDAAVLREAVSRLTPDQQEAVWLRFVAGCDHGEIALVLGRSRGAVNALLHRALRSLRRHLETDEDLVAVLRAA